MCKWWLGIDHSNAKTPNLDIAGTCMIGGTKGLFMIEAKAHDEELRKEEAGKRLKPPVSTNTRRNHVRIEACIAEACIALGGETGSPWALSVDWNYQMSNRFAWAWKLCEQGFPVILVYLGFLNAHEMRKGKKQKPIETAQEWERLVTEHSRALVPAGIWNPQRPIGCGLVPLIRSMEIPFDQPTEEFVLK